jgi:hypothetical protein
MEVSVYSLADIDKWESIVNRLAPKHIYYSYGYNLSFLGHEMGHPYLLHGQSSIGEVIYAFYKRKIHKPKLETSYYDIKTAYGFGGTLYFPIDSNKLTDLASSFDKALAAFCQQEKIVSEFIRIDPSSENYPEIYSRFYSIRKDNKHYFSRTEHSDSELLKQVDLSYHIRGIKRDKNRGFKVYNDQSADGCNNFYKLYSSTMQRHGQKGFLNLPKSFFEKFFEVNKGKFNIFFCCNENDKPLATAIIIHNKQHVEYFLAANIRTEHNHYASHILILEVIKWARDNGFDTFHLGGGVESLRNFKSSLSNASSDYFVAYRIHLPDVYEKLISKGLEKFKIHPSPTGFFFPEYRRFY